MKSLIVSCGVKQCWRKKLHLATKFLENFMNHESPRLSGVKEPVGLGVKEGVISVIGENGSMGTMVVRLFVGGFR